MEIYRLLKRYGLRSVDKRGFRKNFKDGVFVQVKFAEKRYIYFAAGHMERLLREGKMTIKTNRPDGDLFLGYFRPRRGFGGNGVSTNFCKEMVKMYNQEVGGMRIGDILPKEVKRSWVQCVR